MSISILILTHNEEMNLPGCLDSVRWSDDVHVFDSFSTDGTPEIALKYGAKLSLRVFDNRASQLNAALETLPFKYPWLLLIEVDERVTKGLEAELSLMPYHLGPEVAYRIRRQRLVWGKRLKHGEPESFHLRYYSWDSVRYEGGDQAVAVVDGPIGDLEAPIDHHPLGQGVEQWIRRGSLRSSCAPHAMKGARVPCKSALESPVPWRCLLGFFRAIVIKRAFLDGRAGIAFACLQLIHDCSRWVKHQAPSEAVVEKHGILEQVHEARTGGLCP